MNLMLPLSRPAYLSCLRENSAALCVLWAVWLVYTTTYSSHSWFVAHVCLQCKLSCALLYCHCHVTVKETVIQSFKSHFLGDRTSVGLTQAHPNNIVMASSAWFSTLVFSSSFTTSPPHSTRTHTHWNVFCCCLFRYITIHYIHAQCFSVMGIGHQSQVQQMDIIAPLQF